ncbi:type VI secretion protein VasK, partial [Salmonella enterica]|nr:type VI secretion protein VasK [Salmonella enterica]
MNNRFFNLSRITGVTLVMALVALVSGALLWWLGPHWQLSRQQQGLYWLTLNAFVCAVLGVWRYRKQSEPGAVSEQTGSDSASAPLSNHEQGTLTEIRDYLKHRYGLNWRNKVRFVVIAGHHRTANLAVPGIAEAGWLEANNVVAVWGGSLLPGADSARIAVLRKLKRCAVSAIVLVYDGELRQAMQGDLIVRQLNERYKKLGWRVPLYLWEVQKSAWPQEGRETQPVGCLLAPHTTPPELVETLKSLPDTLIEPGVQQGLGSHTHDFLLRLGWQLRNGMAERFHALAVSLLTGPYAVPLRGVMFSPAVYPKDGTDRQRWLPDNSWNAILNDLPSLRIQRAGMAWERTLYQAVLVALGLTCAGVLFSWNTNRQEITDAQQLAVTARDEHQNADKRLAALGELQREMARLQYRSQHGVPWYSRFGQSQNDDLLARLWPEYARSALPLLRDASAARLRDALTAWNALPADSDPRAKLSRDAYNWLKAWLMLNRPEKMDANFFTSTVMALWPRRDGVAPGVWQYEGP